MKSEIRNSEKGLFPRGRVECFLLQRRGACFAKATQARGRGGWPRRSAALQRLGDWAMKKAKSAVMAVVLPCIVTGKDRKSTRLNSSH